jgi:hypothetical protein
MKPSGYDDCEQIKSYYSIYSVPQAAALWCGVPPNQLNGHLSQAIQISRGVWALDYMECLAPRCRAIHEAIDNDLLPACRENGFVVQEHIAPDRRHIRREDLKVWIAKTFPDSKPSFLFDAVERSTHSAINADSFKALQADRDAVKNENEKLKKLNQELKATVENLELENQAIKSCIEKMGTEPKKLDARAETAYLNIIGAMLDLILGKSPAGVKHSIYENQAAIIQGLLGYHSDKFGIAARTLEQKFADGKKSLATSS